MRVLLSRRALVIVCVLAACGGDANVSQNNAPGDNNVSTTPGNQGTNNQTPNNQTSSNNTTLADMGQGTPNNTSSNNNSNSTPNNNHTIAQDMGPLEPPPLDNQAPWPKSRADLSQTGRVPFSLVDDGSDPWIFATHAASSSSPVIDASGITYVGSGSGIFYALDPQGDPVWQHDAGAGVVSSALLDDMGQVIFGTSGGDMIALSAQTGQPNWLSSADDPATTGAQAAGFLASPTVTPDGHLLIGNQNHTVYGMGRVDGQISSRRDVLEEVWSTAAIDIETGDFFIGTNGLLSTSPTLYAFNQASASPQWTQRTPGSITSSPLLLPDRVITTGFDGFVRALDRSSGAPIWSFATRAHLVASPALLSDAMTAVVAGMDGSVYGLNTQTGAQTWRLDWGAPIASSPAVDADDNIYFGTMDGHLVVLDAQGALRWSLKLLDAAQDDFTGSPALSPRGVHLVAESGEVFFIPAGFCERAAQAANTACSTTRTAPADGPRLVLLGADGQPRPQKPRAVHEPIILGLRLGTQGALRASYFEPSSLQVLLDPPLAARHTVAPDRSFLVIEPLDASQPGALSVTISGDYLVDAARQGLATSGGTPGGSFSHTLDIPLAAPGNETSFYPFPEDLTASAGTFVLQGFMPGLPGVVASYGELSDASYVVGLVEGSGERGVGVMIQASARSAQGWSARPEAARITALDLSWHRGHWSADVVAGQDVQVLDDVVTLATSRLTFKEELDGRLEARASAVLRADCADIPRYDQMFDLLGVCAPLALVTAQMFISAANLTAPPELFGSASFSIQDNQLVITLTESQLDPNETFTGVLFVDASTGRALGAGVPERELDAQGLLKRARHDLGQLAPGTSVRAYLIVGTYPAASALLQLP